MTDWIAVGERLPALGQTVLIYSPERVRRCDRLQLAQRVAVIDTVTVGVTSLVRDRPEDGRYSWDGEHTGEDIHSDEVTHWAEVTTEPLELMLPREPRGHCINRPGICVLCRNYTANSHGRMVFCPMCCKKTGGCPVCGPRLEGHLPIIDFEHIPPRMRQNEYGPTFVFSREFAARLQSGRESLTEIRPKRTT